MKQSVFGDTALWGGRNAPFERSRAKGLEDKPFGSTLRQAP
ncbi:hypothetical protein [Azospirillum argentinense]